MCLLNYNHNCCWQAHLRKRRMKCARPSPHRELIDLTEVDKQGEKGKSGKEYCLPKRSEVNTNKNGLCKEFVERGICSSRSWCIYAHPPSHKGMRRKRKRGSMKAMQQHAKKSKSVMVDTYPAEKKRHCPHKRRSNEMLAELSGGILCKDALLLDAATALTSKRFISCGWDPANIHVPNPCDDTHRALKSSGVCTAYHCSLSEFLSKCGGGEGPQRFGTIYLDYCSNMKSRRFRTTPEEDLRKLFSLELLSPDGCVLAVTLLKPPDDAYYEVFLLSKRGGRNRNYDTGRNDEMIKSLSLSC